MSYSGRWQYVTSVDERNSLLADVRAWQMRVQVLEAKDETYKESLKNERRSHARNIAYLQKQLEKKRKQRSRLEGSFAQTEN